MADEQHIEIFKQGSKTWNAWREDNPRIEPDLSDIDFETQVHDYEHLYDTPWFRDYNLDGANLRRITARNSFFERCNFDGAKMPWSDFCYTHFRKCSLVGAELTLSKIGSARFEECCLDRAALSYCSAEDTSFIGSSLRGTDLSKMSMVGADLSRAELVRTRVYGVSTWDIKTEDAIQEDIIITDLFDNAVSVGSIEVAQFIHLLITNPKVRDAIDTITSKVVLILGRFTESRKEVLDQLRSDLKDQNLVPVLFDFQGPFSRNFTETISTLAHLARFVIADLSSPRSVPHELATVIPRLPSVKVQPIIADREEPYGMFSDLQDYPWVLEIIRYQPDELPALASTIVDRVGNSA